MIMVFKTTYKLQGGGALVRVTEVLPLQGSHLFLNSAGVICSELLVSVRNGGRL